MGFIATIEVTITKINANFILIIAIAAIYPNIISLIILFITIIFAQIIPLNL